MDYFAGYSLLSIKYVPYALEQLVSHQKAFGWTCRNWEIYFTSWLVCFIIKPVNATIPKGLTHGLGQTFEIF